MTGFRVNGTSKAAKGSTFLPSNNIGELPKTVDWRTKGYVTPVKDQVHVLLNIKTQQTQSVQQNIIWIIEHVVV